LTNISGFLFLDPEEFANLRCGTEEETSVYILCKCEALVSLRHAYLGPFFLDPEDIVNLSMGAIWNFGKGTVGSFNLVSEYGAQRASFKS
jgi:hypothetical protein